MLEMRGFSLLPPLPTVDVYCACFFSLRQSCSFNEVKTRRACLSRRFLNLLPLFTHTELRPTARTAQLQSHSAVVLRLSFNLQGREGAPRAQTHHTLNLSRRRATAAWTGDGTALRHVPHPPQKMQKNKKKKNGADRRSLASAWLSNPGGLLGGAQVSSVCPQISCVIPTTPCSGSAASSIQRAASCVCEAVGRSGRFRCLQPRACVCAHSATFQPNSSCWLSYNATRPPHKATFHGSSGILTF